VARSQLSDSDTLASGPAESPVELRTDLSSKGAVCGWVDQLSSGYGTPVALSSGSEPSPKPGRLERRTGREWLPSLPECCRVDQCGSVSTGPPSVSLAEFLVNISFALTVYSSCVMSDRRCGHVKSPVSCGVCVCGTHSPARQWCHTVAVVHSLVVCVLSETSMSWLLLAINHWSLSGQCNDR